MIKLKHVEHGFHVFAVCAVLLLIGAVGFAASRVIQKNTSKNVSSDVVWDYNNAENKWFAKSGKPTQCANPFVFEKTPVDLNLLSVIGMPGAYRNPDYKPHGGMRLANMESGNVNVVMPTDATLVGLTRYYEGNPAELQYLLTFETDCGIAFRFDHLATLTPELAKIAETTPEPKLNDTRSDPNITFKRTKFKTGDLLATSVGFVKTKNFGFDFGVYDYRQRNKISENSKWAAIHNQHQSLDWYATCWVEQLPAADIAKAKELSLTVINPAKPNIVSDYCSFAPNTTLDFNNGLRTDG